MSPFDLLQKMRKAAGEAWSQGLSDELVKTFLQKDPKLKEAIEEAYENTLQFAKDYPTLLKLSERDLVRRLQAGFVNFYPSDQTNPYVPAAAAGPWIISCYGAVIHDNGGYGMIGFGHAPKQVLDVIGKRQVMANIMTASFSQIRLYESLAKEVGHTRGKCAFSKFICMNSGSEAMTVATRISDINARRLTDAGAPHAGKKIMFLTLKGGFHGRTERPAQASNSSRKNYDVLASFRNLQNNYTVEPNDVAGLRQAFEWAKKEGVFFEAMLCEPVMGEGDPGKAMTLEFYKAARDLTAREGTLFVIDSIQAGLRATGALSIVDYPGFEGVEPPDMESYSKAVNAGQFPLSILALNEKTAAIYVRGVYGNTKTTNPRAADVAVAVLKAVTPELRKNIQERGREFLQKFAELQKEFPNVITKVQGTGLLCSIEISADSFKIVGEDQLEEFLRRQGLGVIHGGANSLRFTPHFAITSAEVDLVCQLIRYGLQHGPRLRKAS